jgi:hypothetical protein
LLSIAEDAQLAEGVYVPRTLLRFGPLRIAGADQIGDVEALLTTNGRVVRLGA